MVLNYQLLISFFEHAAGPLLPLVTAMFAALVAFKIAAHNARRSSERETISELRKAYAQWCDIIGGIATKKIEENEFENFGMQKNITMGTHIDEIQEHLQSMAKLHQAASRVRILDAALPNEFDLIISVLENKKWDSKLGKLEEYANLSVAANQCAHDLLGRVAGRLLSKKPFGR